ncbi:MAG: hypothetical protein NTV31_04585 [Bacteroidia bacterium]|nr:hypothetical protein [Bacteroidia bacterium]
MKTIISIYHYVSLKLITPTIFSKEYKIILLFLSLVGIVHILLSTSLYGAGLSPDSVYYISAARSLAAGNGLISFYGTPWIEWPPLYPVLLAIPAFAFKIDPLTSAPIINAVLFGLIVYLAGVLLSRHLVSSIVYSLLGVAVILLSSDILQNLATMAWSETLFIFLVLVFLVYLEKFLVKKDRTSFLIFSLSVALACLTRYVGVCLILTGTLALFFYCRDKLRFKLSSIVFFIFISAFPLGLWLIRNYAISGTFTGHRDPSVLTLSQNLDFTFNTLRDWVCYPPKNVSGYRSFLIIIIILIGILAGFVAKGYLRKLKTRLVQIGPIALYVVIYLSFLLYATTTYASDPINWRLLSPIYVPAALLVLVLFDVLLEPFREHTSPLIVNSLLVLAIMAWLVYYPLRVTIINTHTWITEGTGGYSRIEWRNSEIVQYLQQHKLEPGHLVYSNESDILYILANITCQTSLVKIIPNFNDLPSKTAKLSSTWLNDGYDYFVWFDKYPRNYHYTKDELQNSANVRKIIQVSDGAVFSVQRIP